MNISGDKVVLTAFSDSILSDLYRWHQDEWFDDVMSDEVGPKSSVDLKQMYNPIMPPRGRLFVVKEKKEGNAIGIIALYNIDLVNRQAEIFGGIGDKKNRDKGYGAEALGLMIRWGVEQLGLHRIYANIKSHNKESINLLTKAGFKKESVQKDVIFQNGNFINKVIMSYTLNSILPSNINDEVSNFLAKYEKENGKALHDGYINVIKSFCDYIVSLRSAEEGE